MDTTTRKRLRPPYMLLFIEQLRRHNELQPKYVPVWRDTPQRQTSIAPKDTQQNNRSQRLAPDLPPVNLSRPTVTATTARISGPAQPETSDIVAARLTSTSSLADGSKSSSSKVLALSTGEGSASHRAGYISGVGFQLKEPSEGRNNAGAVGANRRASDHFNQRSPGLEPAATLFVNNKARVTPDQTGVVAKIALLDDQKQAQLLPTVVANIQLQQLQAQTQKILQQQQQQLQENLRVASLEKKSESSMGQNAAAPAKLSPSVRAERLVKDVRDSGPQGLSQTPTAFVNESGSSPFDATQNLKNRIKSPFGRGKKVSLSKIIAEQTPDAFKTLGPGFNVRAPGEKSGRPTNEHSGGPMDVVPSDYEHIFHAPSNMADDRSSQPKQQHKNDNNKERNKAKKDGHKAHKRRAPGTPQPSPGKKTS